MGFNGPGRARFQDTKANLRTTQTRERHCTGLLFRCAPHLALRLAKELAIYAVKASVVEVSQSPVIVGGEEHAGLNRCFLLGSGLLRYKRLFRGGRSGLCRSCRNSLFCVDALLRGAFLWGSVLLHGRNLSDRGCHLFETPLPRVPCERA